MILLNVLGLLCIIILLFRPIRIKVLNFDRKYYNIHIYFTDRYFTPKSMNFDDGTHLVPADTLEEFYEVNARQIEILKSQHQWPIF